jgi:cytoskeleton protein RodZ
MVEIGETLREARERRQLSYADVEAATLIPARYLEALEDEAFHRLPEGLYRRSFLREYADFLGLEGSAYVAELELREGPTLSHDAVVPVKMPRRSRRLPSLANVALVAGVLLAVGVAAWALANRNGGSTPRAAPPPSITTRPRPTTTPRTTTTVEPPTRPATLVLTAAHGACWLSVQIQSSGTTVYEQTLAEGGSVRFGLKQPLLIRFGAPSNMTAAIGGHDVSGTLPTSAIDVVATADGLRSAG